MPPLRTPASPRLRLVAAAVALAGMLPACGDSSHRFVVNRDEKVYLKLPSDWADRPYADADPDPLEQITSEVTLVWRSAAAPAGSAGDTAPLLTTAVYEVSGQLNQKMSASLARVAASPLGFDPVLPGDDTQTAQVEVLDYNPLGFDGLNGTRTLFRARDDANSDWNAVYDMSTAFDLSTFRLYVLIVGCSPDCYEANKGAITSAANSWLVKP
jgi:hypothetical protein